MRTCGIILAAGRRTPEDGSAEQNSASPIRTIHWKTAASIRLTKAAIPPPKLNGIPKEVA